jgi:hypothetical protein
MGPAVKISRKLVDIRETSKDAESFRNAGWQLGKPAPAAPAAAPEGPVFKPNVSLTMRRKPKEAPVDSRNILFAGNNDTERIREQVGGRKRTPTITLAPEVAVEITAALDRLEEGAEEVPSSSGRIVSSAPNFFDLFGLNSVPNKPLPTPPTPEEVAAAGIPAVADAKSEEDSKDVLNMQLNPATGKLVVMSGSFSDIIDCTIFYVNISEDFVNEMLFTHRYFAPTKSLLNAFKAHFLNTQSVVQQAKTPEEKKSAEKVMEQVQQRLTGLIVNWIESHFYYFDADANLLEFFQSDFMGTVVIDKERLQHLFHLIDATIIIRNYHTSHRSKKSSVAKEEVLSQLLREDKSGLIMDRRKNLRGYKQAFVAVEAINLIMRKLKIADRAVAISLLDVLRERGAIVNVVKEREF